MVSGDRNRAKTWHLFYQRNHHLGIDMTAKNNPKIDHKSAAGKVAPQPRPIKVPMTDDRARAIQRHTMKTTGTVKKTDFAAIAQRVADRNIKAGIVPPRKP
jgi:hypothetical protein